MSSFRNAFKAGLSIALAILCADAQAWNAQGHQAIGAIADQLLEGTPALTHVRKILASESLSTASVWADCAKSVDERGSFSYQSSDRFPECSPFDTPEGRANLEDYVRRNQDRCGVAPGQETCHRQYHYADLDSFAGAYRPGAAGSSDHDVVSGVLAAVARLQGRPVPPPFAILTEQEALRLLVHWVGDLHQPLHIASVHIDPEGQVVRNLEPLPEGTETRGGNLVAHRGRSLHAEWDEVPQDVATKAFITSSLSGAKSLGPTSGTMEEWPLAWASESVVASNTVFDGLILSSRHCTVEGRCGWLADSPESYAGVRMEIQRAAVIKAGARLASLLNAIWPR